jgi:hypothetical protein
MADARTAPLSAEAVEIRPPRSGFPATLFDTAAFIAALYRRPSPAILNLTPRALRGFPYPFTFDSVRRHA